MHSHAPVVPFMSPVVSLGAVAGFWPLAAQQYRRRPKKLICAFFGRQSSCCKVTSISMRRASGASFDSP